MKNQRLVWAATIAVICLSMGSHQALAAPCRQLAAIERASARQILGIKPTLASQFDAALCRIDLTKRLSVISYKIDGLELTPLWQHPTTDPRYPLPALLIDGRFAGRLPEHVPAEYPLLVSLEMYKIKNDIPFLICLKSVTKGEGDTPNYPAILLHDRHYSSENKLPVCDKYGG